MMVGRRQEDRSFSGVIALLLFAAFAACVLLVLASGSKIYAGLVARDRALGETRTCVRFLETKIRQAESAEMVSVDEVDGVKRLVISFGRDRGDLVTYLYTYDGWLTELFTFSDREFAPENGRRIARADGFDAEILDGLLEIDIVDASGEPHEIALDMRGGEL